MQLVRLGSRSFYRWAIPDDALGPDSICYAAGVGLDFSFERKTHERFNCKWELFDPTPVCTDYMATVPTEDWFRFHPVGLWNVGGPTVFHYGPFHRGADSGSITDGRVAATLVLECKTVAAIMRELGHSRLDILKLDIEGAENAVVRDMLANGILPRLLLVEFHSGAEDDQSHGALLDVGYRMLTDGGGQGHRTYALEA